MLSEAQTTIETLNNTLGIFYSKIDKIKISNDHWQLLVYQDLNSLKQAIDSNSRILNSIIEFIDEPVPRKIALKTEIHTHVSLLTQIADTIDEKYQNILIGTTRQKRGLINGLGTIWKSITGNLDSSDGEYFNNCIDKVVKDEHEIERLMQKQISVTTSVIKNFNNTIQKLQIDEETFNKDILDIQATLVNISDDLSYYESQIKLLEVCELVMESSTFLLDQINNILNSISFARLRIIHDSIISPFDLLESLKEIPQRLKNTNLPIPLQLSNIADYLNIIQLKAYHLDNKIVFVLNIPLVEPEIYNLYRLYPIPLTDNRTGFNHVLSTTMRYIAGNDDSTFYLQVQNLDKCKSAQDWLICPDLLPHPVDSNAACEAQLLGPQFKLPLNCVSLTLSTTGYNVQEVKANTWLVSTAEAVPIIVKCEEEDKPLSKMITSSSLVHLEPKCSAYIGSTRIQSRRYSVSKIEYNHHPILVPFNCCSKLPSKTTLPNLKPLKLNKLNVEDLNIAHHQLNKYSEELDNLMNDSVITKKISWSTILVIITLILILVFLLIRRYQKRRTIRIGISTSNDDQPPRPGPQIQLRQSLENRPRRRQSIHLGEPIEEIPLDFGKSSIA